MFKKIKEIYNKCLEGESDEIVATTLKDYIMSPGTTWYWSLLALHLLIVLFLLLPSGNLLHKLAGLTLVLILPGYTLLQAAYLEEFKNKLIELVASISVSLSIASLTGIFMIYSPSGFNPTITSLLLYLESLIFLHISVLRRYKKFSRISF